MSSQQSELLKNVISLYNKYMNDSSSQNPSNSTLEGKTMFISKQDVALCEAYSEIADSMNISEVAPYITTLSEFFVSHSQNISEDSTPTDILPASDQSSDASTDADTSDLSDDETTFADKYPTIDQDKVLLDTYTEWLSSIKGKPFFRTIKSYYELYLSRTLNFLDRDFLWKLLKAISSTLTHLLIEGEQHEEALCLIDKYYDSLIQCLNSVVHASDKEDVVSSFQYMVDFLGISKDFSDDTPDSSNEDPNFES